MARKPTHLAAEPRSEPIKTQVALRRLHDLTTKPAAPDRMRREAEDMVKVWLAGTGDDRRIELHKKLGEMQEELQAGIEARPG